MTDGEMQKEKKLRKKYDKGDMKKNMKDQYGEEEQENLLWQDSQDCDGRQVFLWFCYLRERHCTS